VLGAVVFPLTSLPLCFPLLSSLCLGAFMAKIVHFSLNNTGILPYFQQKVNKNPVFFQKTFILA
jgi:hypothetical protein